MSMMQYLRRDERGATIVIASLSMVVLLGFAAIAIDVAHSYNQRNEDQAASDTGAVAAGLFVAFKTQSQAMADATAEVVRITYNNIAPTMTFAEWQTAWTGCTDPTRPAEYVLSGPGTGCVTFASDLSKIRVKVPIVDVETTFGAVLGRSAIETDAFAEVAAQYGEGLGAILPFGLPGVSGGNTEICLKTGPQPQLPPCDGPVTGNFGYLDFTRFGGAPVYASQKCSFSNAPKAVAQNIAHGVDHGLGTYDPALPPDPDNPETQVRFDLDICGTNDTGAPNATDTATGNMAKTIEDGFLQGENGWPGRLTLTNSGLPFVNRPNVHGQASVDDTPLWNFLNDPSGASLCATELAADADGDGNAVLDTKAEMVICLDAWDPGDGVIFIDDLAASARMAWVPLLNQWTFPTGNKTVTFKEFRPVYVQTFYAKCTGGSGGGSCEDVWEAGEGSSITSGKDFIAVSSLQFDKRMLPEVVLQGQPGTDGQFEYYLIR